VGAERGEVKKAEEGWWAVIPSAGKCCLLALTQELRFHSAKTLRHSANNEPLLTPIISTMASQRPSRVITEPKRFREYPGPVAVENEGG
jgi:hypothetical protein